MGAQKASAGDRSEPFRQAVPSLSLSVERGTQAVPNDGRFHVVLGESVIYSANSQKEALREYRALRDRLLPPAGQGIDVQAIIRREAAEHQAQRFLAESRRAKRAKALRKGGKGGSGGVSG